MRGNAEGEEEMDQPAEQRVQSDADNGDLINTKTRVKGAHHCVLLSHG